MANDPPVLGCGCRLCAQAAATNTNQSDDGIVERLLRKSASEKANTPFGVTPPSLCRETADHIRTLEARLAAVEGRAIDIAEAEAQRCRDGVSRCPKWSPAQAEWSRARDACLNIVDALRALATPPELSKDDAR